MFVIVMDWEDSSGNRNQLLDNDPVYVGEWEKHVNMCTYWQKLRLETGLTITQAKYWQVVQFQNVVLPCLLRQTQEKLLQTHINPYCIKLLYNLFCLYMCAQICCSIVGWDIIDYYSRNYANRIPPTQKMTFYWIHFNFVPLSKHFPVRINSIWYIDLNLWSYTSVIFQ